MPFDTELALALGLADRSDPVALEHFRAPRVDTKADGTPVTQGDRAVESLLRAGIAGAFPADAIVGEEEGERAGGERRWIVDPIDGTANYARRIPVWATLVALEDAEGLAVSVVSAPALGARWWAVRGGGAFRDGVRIAVSPTADLSEAHVCTGDPAWAQRTGNEDAFRALARATRRTRGFGDFWGYCMVAEGSMDVAVEFAPQAWWDIAAPMLLVREAGGRATALDGSDDVRAGALVATNGALHAPVLGLLGS